MTFTPTQAAQRIGNTIPTMAEEQGIELTDLDIPTSMTIADLETIAQRLGVQCSDIAARAEA